MAFPSSHDPPQTGSSRVPDMGMHEGLSHSRVSSNQFSDHLHPHGTGISHHHSPNYLVPPPPVEAPVTQTVGVTPHQQQAYPFSVNSDWNHAAASLGEPNQEVLAASASFSTVSISSLSAHSPDLPAYPQQFEPNNLYFSEAQPPHGANTAPYQNPYTPPSYPAYLPYAFTAGADVGPPPLNVMTGSQTELVDSSTWSTDASVQFLVEPGFYPGDGYAEAGPFRIPDPPAPLQTPFIAASPSQTAGAPHGRTGGGRRGHSFWQVKTTRNPNGCLSCRLRHKKCPAIHNPSARDSDDRCSECTKLNIECLKRYGELYPEALTDQRQRQCKETIKRFTKHRPNRLGPTLPLDHYCRAEASASMENTRSSHSRNPPHPLPNSGHQIPPPLLVVQPSPQQDAPLAHQQPAVSPPYGTLYISYPTLPRTPSSYNSSVPSSPMVSSPALSEYSQFPESGYPSDPNFPHSPAVPNLPIEGLDWPDPSPNCTSGAPLLNRASSFSIQQSARSEMDESPEYGASGGSSSRSHDMYPPHNGQSSYRHY